MQKWVQRVVIGCAGFFVVSLLVMNIVYRGSEIPSNWWLVWVGFGIYVCGAVGLVGGGVLMALNKTRASD